MSEEHPDAGPADPAIAPQPAPAPAVTESAPVPVTEGEQPAQVPAETESLTEPTIKPHTDEPGILRIGEEVPKEGEPPAETEKPAEVTEPPEEAVKYDLKFPDGVEVQAERIETFANFAREQKFSPETAQSLVQMHAEAMQAYDSAVLQRQHDQFGEWRREMRTQVQADPILGGAGFETNQANAISGLKFLVGEVMRQAATQGHPMPEFGSALDQRLLATGMCDTPEFVWLGLAANAIAQKLREPAPVPANTPRAPIEGASGAPNGQAGRLRYTHSRGGSRRTP